MGKGKGKGKGKGGASGCWEGQLPEDVRAAKRLIRNYQHWKARNAAQV